MGTRLAGDWLAWIGRLPGGAASELGVGAEGKDARAETGSAAARVPVRREPSSCMHGVHAHPDWAVPPRAQTIPGCAHRRRKGNAVAEAFHGRATDALRPRTDSKLYPRPGGRGAWLLDPTAVVSGPYSQKEAAPSLVLVSANHVSMRVGVRWMRGRSAGWLSPQSSLASRRSGGRPAQTARTVSGLGALETSAARNGHRLLIAAWPAPGWTVTALSPTTLTPPGCNRLEARLGLKFSSPHLRSQVQPAPPCGPAHASMAVPLAERLTGDASDAGQTLYPPGISASAH